jgi:hypothetical protein
MVMGRILFAVFDAGGGGDPDDSDEGDQAKRYLRVLERERNRHEIDEQGEPVFAFDGFVLLLKLARMAQTASDGQTQEEKAEASQDHGRDVDGDRERVHIFDEDVGGGEGQQREAEEKAKVGIEDKLVSLIGAMDEVVMINPIDPDEGKRDEIEAQRVGRTARIPARPF